MQLKKHNLESTLWCFHVARFKASFGAGPSLPSALAREVGAASGEAALQGPQRGTSMFLVSQRKQARKQSRRAKPRGFVSGRAKGDSATKELKRGATSRKEVSVVTLK